MKRASGQTFFKAMSEAQSKGMSLIEILIALTLLALAGTFIAGKVFENLNEGQVNSARIQMGNLAERLKEFKRKCNFYPTADQGLEALVSEPQGGRTCKRYPPGGFIEGGKVPLDPWDNRFVYETDGRSFNLKSLGADGQDGGEGNDKDILLYENQGGGAGGAGQGAVSTDQAPETQQAQ